MSRDNEEEEGLKDWEEISVQQSPAKEWETLLNSSSSDASLQFDFSIFPPSRHEGLPIQCLQPEQSEPVTEPSMEVSGSEQCQDEQEEEEKEGESGFRAQVAGAMEKGLLCFNFLWSKVLIAYPDCHSRAIWSFAVVASVTALIIIRRKCRARNKLLLLQIMERDEASLVPSVKAEAKSVCAMTRGRDKVCCPYEAGGGGGHGFLCPICMQIINNAFLTACGHIFCYMCILTHLHHKCDCCCCGHYLTSNPLFPNL